MQTINVRGTVRRQRGAFTLLEITVVLGIAAILMASAAPRFVALRDAASGRAALADLGAAFAAARQLAISQRTVVSVVFDTAGGVVQVRSAGGRTIRHPLRAMYGVAVGSDRDSAVYDPRGLGYGLSNLSVTIRRGTFVDTLTMSRLGRVRW